MNFLEYFLQAPWPNKEFRNMISILDLSYIKPTIIGNTRHIKLNSIKSMENMRGEVHLIKFLIHNLPNIETITIE